MAQVTMKAMLDAGVHFGHQTQRWNPKMKPYVFTARGGIHIIDLQKSVESAKQAAEFVTKVASHGGRMIFVGTKKQAQEAVQAAAESCGQFYVTKRWLGGMLTNFSTIKASIDRLRRIDLMREKGELELLTKKEKFKMEKESEKLLEYLEGIKDMRDMPAALFVVDLNKEHIAVAEAKRLGIPVIGIADTNVDPTVIEYPIPGNDDAIRSIKLFSTLVAESFKEGAAIWEQKKRSSSDKGSDNEVDQAREASAASPQQRDRGDRNRKPRPANTGGRKETDAPAAVSAGPAVVRVTRARKLVAAGLADEVEIAQELDESGKAKTETEE